MADQVYQPIVSDDDDQSETPSPQTELPIESWNEVKSRFEEDKSDLTTEEASQRQRQPDPHSAEDAHARPITVHKVKGDGPLTLNEAVDDALYSKWFQHGKELREAGLTDKQTAEIAADAIERAQRMDPVAPPPPEVKVLDHFGEDPDRPLTVTEAADALISWRERHQQEQQEALQELAGEAAAERQAEAQQAQQLQPEPQRQQPPDPVQTQRQQLAQEHQRLTYLKKMEGIEASWRHNYDELVGAVVAEFPSLRNGPPDPAHVEQLRQQDPARFQKLAKFRPAAKGPSAKDRSPGTTAECA